MASLVWTPSKIRAAGSGKYGERREPRMGVMVHYDGSTSDQGGLNWFADPRCEVSYQVLVLDDGRWAQIAPDGARAWHAGVCRTSDPARLPYKDANSAFYGISATTDGLHGATAAQTLTIAWHIRRWFEAERWSLADTWRIVGHDTEAVFPAGHAKAGKRGRKEDPTGPDPLNPIVSVDDLRYLVPRISL